MKVQSKIRAWIPTERNWLDKLAAPSGGKSISVGALVRKYGKTRATFDISYISYQNYTNICQVPLKDFNLKRLS